MRVHTGAGTLAAEWPLIGRDDELARIVDAREREDCRGIVVSAGIASQLLPRLAVKATTLSSGEILGPRITPGAPAGPSTLPVRSYQSSWFIPPAALPVQYRSTPFSETVTGA